MHLRHMSQVHSWCAATTNKIYGCIRVASLGAVARGVPPSGLCELIVVPTISSACATNPYRMGTSEHEQTTTNICAGGGLKMLNTCKRIYYIIIKLYLSLYSRFT